MGLVAGSTWDPPRPGIETTSPTLADGFFTSEPPGKPYNNVLACYIIVYKIIIMNIKVHVILITNIHIELMLLNCGVGEDS